jgi:hypothetical protein
MSDLSSVFCGMLENGLVIPITYNENTTLMLYQPDGQVFSPDQWSRIAEAEIRRLENESKTGSKTLPEDEPSSSAD